MKLETRLVVRLATMGLDAQQIETLAKAERALSRWDTDRCNGDVQDNEDGTFSDRNGNKVRNRGGSALTRAAKAISGTTWRLYHQTDPRGCSLYLYNPDSLGDFAKRVGAESVTIQSCYTSIGFAVCA